MAAAISCMRALPAGFASTCRIETMPNTMAAIAQTSAKMRPVDMVLLPVAGSRGRRAFVRARAGCRACGKNALFCQSRGAGLKLELGRELFRHCDVLQAHITRKSVLERRRRFAA